MDFKKCQIFTPSNIVDLMLDEIGYKTEILNKKIIDNSCGNGNFLIKIIERIINLAKHNKINKRETASLIETNVIGCEIDDVVYCDCINRLNDYIKSQKLPKINWNIMNCDGLKYGENRSFDYVVGNPPYIAYGDLGENVRAQVKRGFTTCEIGKFDYSYAFIEKGLNLLKENGKMAFITPSNMFKTVFGHNLREFIKPKLIKIIDCQNIKVFEKVLISPSITIYDKNKENTIVCYKHLNDDEEIFIPKNTLSNKWDFTNYTSNALRQFGHYFKVSNSVATLANKIFIHKCNENGDVIINGNTFENQVLNTAKSPRSLRYGYVEKIIFPYFYNETGMIRIKEGEFQETYPQTYDYMLRQRTKLLKTDKDHNAEWFQFGRSQALQHLNQDKLLISTIITNEVCVYKLDKEDIPYAGLYIVVREGNDQYNLDDAIQLLKSPNFYKYLKSKGIKVNGNSLRISSKDVEDYCF